MVIRAVGRSLEWIDRCWSRAFMERSRQMPHLLVALFHTVVDEPAASARLLAPGQAVTLDDLRRFLDAVLSAGYFPLSLHELLAGREWTRRYVLVTFDDGYYNNAYAVPVLEQFKVPATFFISTGHVRQSRAFWWDVAARAWRAQGMSDRQIRAGLQRLKYRTAADVEDSLTQQLGAGALRPVSDLDRPFAEHELRDFARNRWVSLGNHTAQHTILTRCTPAEAELAIAEGQRELESITGVRPTAIAYPDGAFSPFVAQAAHRTGHRLGFTCVPKSNALPLDSDSSMLIGRHMIMPRQDYRATLTALAAPAVLPSARIRSMAVRLLQVGSHHGQRQPVQAAQAARER
jgi:peptidoglycan/xylan/chitin deacetylase (PgdA/CDA1 family)